MIVFSLCDRSGGHRPVAATMGKSNSRTIFVIARSSGRTYCFSWVKWRTAEQFDRACASARMKIVSDSIMSGSIWITLWLRTNVKVLRSVSDGQGSGMGAQTCWLEYDILGQRTVRAYSVGERAAGEVSSCFDWHAHASWRPNHVHPRMVLKSATKTMSKDTTRLSATGRSLPILGSKYF